MIFLDTLCSAPLIDIKAIQSVRFGIAGDEKENVFDLFEDFFWNGGWNYSVKSVNSTLYY